MNSVLQQTANCQITICLTQGVHPKGLSKFGEGVVGRKLLKLRIHTMKKSFADDSCQIG